MSEFLINNPEDDNFEVIDFDQEQIRSSSSNAINSSASYAPRNISLSSVTSESYDDCGLSTSTSSPTLKKVDDNILQTSISNSNMNSTTDNPLLRSPSIDSSSSSSTTSLPSSTVSSSASSSFTSSNFDISKIHQNILDIIPITEEDKEENKEGRIEEKYKESNVYSKEGEEEKEEEERKEFEKNKKFHRINCDDLTKKNFLSSESCSSLLSTFKIDKVFSKYNKEDSEDETQEIRNEKRNKNFPIDSNEINFEERFDTKEDKWNKERERERMYELEGKRRSTGRRKKKRDGEDEEVEDESEEDEDLYETTSSSFKDILPIENIRHGISNLSLLFNHLKVKIGEKKREKLGDDFEEKLKEKVITTKKEIQERVSYFIIIFFYYV